MSSEAQIRQLLNSYNSRLHMLQQRQAAMGISTPADVLVEIEQIEAEIASLQAKLAGGKGYNLPAIRDLLTSAFSSEELTELLYDEFPHVYEDVASGMSKSQKIVRLIEYCERRLLMPKLLMAVRQYNPAQYFQYEKQLFLEEPSSETIDERVAQVAPLKKTRLLGNPYVVGNPIQPDNTKVFLGRFDIAKSIISEIRRSGQKPSILLYGRRRMGKTSALLNISRLIRDRNILPVYISGQSVKFHTNIDFCYYMIQAINEQLQQNLINTTVFQQKGFLTRTTFMPNPILTLSEFFTECYRLLELHERYTLLSIDEYEEIDQHMNTSPGNHHERGITRELLLELRDTLQHKPRFMFLFAGTHFLRDLSTVNWSEIFINVKTLHISFLERGDGYKLLTRPVPELRYESTGLIERILDTTGCQPFLLQAIASELINIANSKDTRVVTSQLLDEAIEGTLDEHGTYFDYIWDTECTSSRQQELLRLIAGQAPNVSETMLGSYQDELRDLIRREVLKVQKGFVSFTMPMVMLWMKKNIHIL